MVKKFLILACVANLVVALTGGALGHGEKHNPTRHSSMMSNGIPNQYKNLSNPVKATETELRAGDLMFAEQCAMCHGPGGNGKSEAGAALEPPALELKSMMGMPMVTDGYLMWTLSEGGEALGTDMPGFKDALSERERWQNIRIMISGFVSS